MLPISCLSSFCIVYIITLTAWFWCLTLRYLTSRVDRLLHLPSAEAVSAQPNAHPRM